MNAPNSNIQTPITAVPRLGQGNVKITFLSGEELEMRPTLNAVQILSQKYGGLQNLLDKMQQLDFAAILDVMTLGLGPRYQTAKQRDWLANQAFASGLTDDTGGIAFACQTYVLMLMRGGKPLPSNTEEAAAETDEAPQGNPPSSN